MRLEVIETSKEVHFFEKLLPGTSLGIFLHKIASRKTVPPNIFLIVPFGDFHIFFKLNSVRRKGAIKIYIFDEVTDFTGDFHNFLSSFKLQQLQSNICCKK